MARIETTSRTLYSFAELSDGAKEAARDAWRNSDTDRDCSDFDDWQSVATILGIDFDTDRIPLHGGGSRKQPRIYYSHSYSQGDGASFVGWYSYAKGSSAAIRAYAPLDTVLHSIADRLATVQRSAFYRLQATITQSSRYYHSNTMNVDTSRTDDTEPSGDACDTIEQCMRDFADWIYRSVQAQSDYLDSAEYIDEMLEANEYEFLADGSMA